MYAFVYGSLKRGFGNHRLLEGSEFIGEARLSRCGAMYSLGGFPAVTLGNRVSPIHGEVYRIDEDTLESLDILEGHPRFYQRTTVTVLMEDDIADVEHIEAYVYLMDADSPYLRGEPIASGYWRDPRTQRVV